MVLFRFFHQSTYLPWISFNSMNPTAETSIHKRGSTAPETARSLPYRSKPERSVRLMQVANPWKHLGNLHRGFEGFPWVGFHVWPLWKILWKKRRLVACWLIFMLFFWSSTNNYSQIFSDAMFMYGPLAFSFRAWCSAFGMELFQGQWYL